MIGDVWLMGRSSDAEAGGASLMLLLVSLYCKVASYIRPCGDCICTIRKAGVSINQRHEELGAFSLSECEREEEKLKEREKLLLQSTLPISFITSHHI